MWENFLNLGVSLSGFCCIHVKQHNIADYVNTQQHSCENLKSHRFRYFLLTS